MAQGRKIPKKVDPQKKTIVKKKTTIDPKIIEEAGYVFGRPTKYEARFCAMLIDHMAEGYSFDSFAGKVNICRDTLYEWRSKYPDFSYAYKMGCMKRRVIDEKVFNEITRGERVANPAPILFKMKSVHGMCEDVLGKKKLKMLQLDSMTPEQIKELAVKLLKD